MKTIDGTLRNENWKYITDKKGLVIARDMRLTLEESLKLVSEAIKIERIKYGYKVFIIDKGENIALFFRFGNETTKTGESVEGFIRRNWGE